MEKVLKGPQKVRDSGTPQVRERVWRRLKINPLNEAGEKDKRNN